MTNEQIALVWKSWNKIVPISDRAARVFDEHLFATNPEFRPLFPADMTEQWRKLMLTIGVVIAGQAGVEDIVPAVKAPARRHIAYGVKNEGYALVGTALPWALERSLDAEFTPAVREAWTTVYGVFATTMIEAGNPL